MLNSIQRLLILVLLSVAAGCTQAPQAKPQAESSPAANFSIAAPINKAKQTAVDVKQKGREREQLDPQAQPEPSPEPAK